MELLLANHADPGLATPHGGAPLHYAVGIGEVRVAKALIQAGANVNQPGGFKKGTPLMDACSSWPHPTIITPLLEAGTDLQATDNAGNTALHNAINPLLSPPLVELLLEKGADPQRKDNNGITPIARARLLGFEDLARSLEERVGSTHAVALPSLDAMAPTLPVMATPTTRYVLPILLAQGHFGGPAPEKAAARRQARQELRSLFDVYNAEQLKEHLREPDAFEPRHQDDEGILPKNANLSETSASLVATAKAIHTATANGAADDSAWIQSHIIYLANLGVSAEYLQPEEGEAIVHTASAALEGKHGSWKEFLNSFLLGANTRAAWEASRYANIRDRILEAGLQWP